jgi:hypothetical protein
MQAHRNSALEFPNVERCVRFRTNVLVTARGERKFCAAVAFFAILSELFEKEEAAQ